MILRVEGAQMSTDHSDELEHLDHHLGADVTAELHREVRMEAARRNTSNAQILREALREYLDSQPS